jgi:hypothetical protein
MGAMLAAVLVFAMFVGPLAVRIVFDRRAERAAVVAADVRGAVRRRLGGESMVSIHVEPRGWWSAGRVLLFAPSGYGDLIEKAWPAVVTRVPAGYELVVRAARPQPPRIDRGASGLAQAA